MAESHVKSEMICEHLQSLADNYMDMIIYANYFFMAIVVLMLQPWIYVENATEVLGEMYFRILGAAGIIDGTLSILTILFYKLYIRKHQQEQNSFSGGIQTGQKTQKKGFSIWIWLLLTYLLLQIVLPLIFYSSRFFR